jgi:hypothetical protein
MGEPVGLVEFLLARLTEDEESAWRLINRATDELFRPDRVRPPSAAHPSADALMLEPERMLDEIDAKRSILATALTLAETNCDTSTASILRALAAPYADHREYRPEWSQEAHLSGCSAGPASNTGPSARSSGPAGEPADPADQLTTSAEDPERA